MKLQFEFLFEAWEISPHHMQHQMTALTTLSCMMVNYDCQFGQIKEHQRDKKGTPLASVREFPEMVRHWELQANQ